MIFVVLRRQGRAKCFTSVRGIMARIIKKCTGIIQSQVDLWLFEAKRTTISVMSAAERSQSVKWLENVLSVADMYALTVPRWWEIRFTVNNMFLLLHR